MTHIKIQKGLNIPIKGQPKGEIKFFGKSKPTQIALDLKPFETIKFKLLATIGDRVKIGQPLAEDKMTSGRMFVSPACGVVKDIRRGLKRRLLEIVIDVEQNEEFHEFSKMDVSKASKDEIIERLKNGGVFSSIHQRPFSILADPSKPPRDIFVKAIESAPFTPPSKLQVAGKEKEFQIGLNALSKITEGKVHLVYSEKSTATAFINAENVIKHTAEGPHPIGTYSVHIQSIAPIKSIEDIVWVLNVSDVIEIGSLLENGRYSVDRVISIAGPGVSVDKIGFYKGRVGMPVSSLVDEKVNENSSRLISGNPLTGKKVEQDDFLGFNDFVFCAIPESDEREMLHFFRAGKEKYSMSKAYVSGHMDNTKREYDFTTNQHGEKRPFIVADLYDKVQPLNISTMLLVKAVMAEDFELAESLGLLEVDSEDFALATFVCPSKMEMTDIMEHGIQQYAKEILS